MKTRPILFSGPMVRAILNGTKTQTRRIVKLRDGSLPEEGVAFFEDGRFDKVMDFSKTYPYWQPLSCPYGKAGDTLWVRETWAEVTGPVQGETKEDFGRKGVIFRADEGNDSNLLKGIWKPSIFMRRFASRITLEVVSVRVQRLQDISEADAIAEGVERIPGANGHRGFRDYLNPGDDNAGWLCCVESYRTLWESINGPGSWAADPFVWVVEFKKP